MSTLNLSRFMVCPECRRKFDPMNEQDAQEIAFGHDCEA